MHVRPIKTIHAATALLLTLLFGLALLSAAGSQLAYAESSSLTVGTQATASSARAILYKNGDLVLQNTTNPDGKKGHTANDVAKKYNTLRRSFVDHGETYTAFSWHMDRDAIKRVSVNGTVSVDTMLKMFAECTNLKSVNLKGLDTSRVKDMSSVFYQCFSLESVDLSSLDVSNATSMNGIFSDCSYLRTVNMSGLDTTSIDTSWAFANCYALSTLVLGPKTSLFEDCILPEGSWSHAGTSRRLGTTAAFIAATGRADSAGTWRFASSQPVDNGAYAILYKNGDFVIQNSAKPDGSVGHTSAKVVKVYDKIGRFVHAENNNDLVKPWYNERDLIRNVAVNGNVYIRGYAGVSWMFAHCKNLKTADLTGLTSTEFWLPFLDCNSLSVLVLDKNTRVEGETWPLKGSWTSFSTSKKYASSTKFMKALSKAPQPGVWVRSGSDIDISAVTVRTASATYTGEALTPKAVVKLGKKTLALGTDYTVSYSKNKSAGKAVITIKGKGDYAGTVQRNFTIKKAANTLRVSGKTASVGFNENSATKIKAAKVYRYTDKGNGKRSFKRVESGSSPYLEVNAKSGAITVAKGAPKKTHKVRVAITAAGNKNYKKKTKTVTVKVVVE